MRRASCGANVVQAARLSVPVPPHTGAVWGGRRLGFQREGPRRLQIALAVGQLSEAQQGLGQHTARLVAQSKDRVLEDVAALDESPLHKVV